MAESIGNRVIQGAVVSVGECGVVLRLGEELRTNMTITKEHAQ